VSFVIILTLKVHLFSKKKNERNVNINVSKHKKNTIKKYILTFKFKNVYIQRG